MKGSVSLYTSKANETLTGVCSKESKGLFLETGTYLEKGELITLKGLAPRWLPRDGICRERSLTSATKGLRALIVVVISTD